MAGRGKPERGTGVPMFLRYPNLDWLATFLSLLVIAAYYFRAELPPWEGWFWLSNENPPFWYGYLGTAALAVFGVVYVVSRLLARHEHVSLADSEPILQEPNLERLGVYLGLLLGLGMSLKNGSRGWANIYWGDEWYWGSVFWRYIGPSMLVVLVLILLLVLFRRLPVRPQRDVFPHAGWLVALAIVFQNVIAQTITGPISSWGEMVFNLYYFLLFLLSAVILYHYHVVKRLAHGDGGERFSPAVAAGAAPVVGAPAIVAEDPWWLGEDGEGAAEDDEAVAESDWDAPESDEAVMAGALATEPRDTPDTEVVAPEAMETYTEEPDRDTLETAGGLEPSGLDGGEDGLSATTLGADAGDETDDDTVEADAASPDTMLDDPETYFEADAAEQRVAEAGDAESTEVDELTDTASEESVYVDLEPAVDETGPETDDNATPDGGDDGEDGTRQARPDTPHDW